MDSHCSTPGPQPGPERHVAVIGAGHWGKELVRAFDSLGALRVVCDADAARLDALVTSPGVKRCCHVGECLRSPEVDAVAIAAPASIHYELVRSALEAGKDVMVEMPLALSVRDGQELADTAAAANRVLMAGNVLRYHPAVCKLKELIDTGEMGRVEYICSNRLSLDPLRVEENILWSFAPHEVSVILGLLGEMPVAASCQGGDYVGRGVSDVTISQLVFAGGVRAQVFVSRLRPFKEHWLVVVGSDKMAVFDEAAQPTLVTYPRGDWSGSVPSVAEAAGEPVPIDVTEPMTAECRAFLESLETRRPPATDGPEELRVLEVLDACERSLANDGMRTLVQSEGHSRPFHLRRSRVSIRNRRHASAARVARVIRCRDPGAESRLRPGLVRSPGPAYYQAATARPSTKNVFNHKRG
jgi:UDP-2-acetamido-3-amino-2,3-dideoxy-glucuronate N-acetyltransferase